MSTLQDELAAWGEYNEEYGCDLNLAAYRAMIAATGEVVPKVSAVVTDQGTFTPATPVTVDASGAEADAAVLHATGTWSVK